MATTDPFLSKIDLSQARSWEPLTQLQLLAAGTRHDLPGATFGPRKQFSWELVWMRVGALDLKIDERSYRLCSNDVALVPPGAVDRYDWMGERRVVHSFLHFELGPLPRGWPPLDCWSGVYSLGPPGFLQEALSVLSGLPAENPDFWTIVGGPMLELVLRVLLMGGGVPGAPKAEIPSCVDRALDWMRSRIQAEASSRFSLAEVASVAGVDAAYLCRAFRASLDISPMSCARLMRLDRAIALLERTETSIKEIADAAGFANAFHFSRCFGSTFHMSPTQFREDFRRGIVHRLVTPAFERLAAQYIIINEPALSYAKLRSEHGPETPGGFRSSGT